MSVLLLVSELRLAQRCRLDTKVIGKFKGKSFSFFKGKMIIKQNKTKHTFYACYLNMKIFLAYYVKHSYLYFHYLKSFYSQILTPLCKAW